MSKKKLVHVVIDVEASGNVPALFDMISFGAVVIEPSLTRTFYGETAPLHGAFNPKCYELTNMTREQHLDMPHPVETMKRFAAWVDEISEGRGEVKMVSDNPAFDFSFIAWYSWKFLGRSPVGHSARRIGDFYAGLNKSWSNSSKWKRKRITKHTHHPVDDAKGNAEAIMAIFKEADLKPFW